MSEATYVCANDYTLVGDDVMTCHVDGVWSGVGADCGMYLCALLRLVKLYNRKKNVRPRQTSLSR